MENFLSRLMIGGACGLMLIVAACSNPQEAIDKAEYVCKDGVQYFSYEKMDSSGHVNFSIVPHFKLDGSLYPCGKNVTDEATNVSEY